MRSTRFTRWRLVAAIAAIVAAGSALRAASAADHRDSAFLTANPASDIADVYSFVSPNDPDRLVVVMTVAGLIPPSEASMAVFDPDVVYAFKIDVDGDAVEDYVLQAYVTGGSGPTQVMHFRGPAIPTYTGARTRLVTGAETGTVQVSRGTTPVVASRNGMDVFAGLRDDPFFFDLNAYVSIITGQSPGFNDPGIDTFAGTNVLAIAAEFPVSQLGGATRIGVWGTTSRPAN